MEIPLQFCVIWTIFAARCYASAAYAVMRCLSVCLGVGRIRVFCQNEYTYFFHQRVATPFFTPNIMAILRRGPPNADGVGKNRDHRRIAGYRSRTGGVRTTTATIQRAVYCTDRHASVNVVHRNQHERLRRRKENRI